MYFHNLDNPTKMMSGAAISMWYLKKISAYQFNKSLQNQFCITNLKTLQTGIFQKFRQVYNNLVLPELIFTEKKKKKNHSAKALYNVPLEFIRALKQNKIFQDIFLVFQQSVIRYAIFIKTEKNSFSLSEVDLGSFTS